jgi:hypothetical protein
MIVVITIAEARQILADNGFNTSESHIRAGIECGAYPFGVCIPAAKSHTFEVYKPLLMRWIDERQEKISRKEQTP